MYMCVCLCAVEVFLALYVVYVLVVVFGHMIYQHQKQRAAHSQLAAINGIVTGSFLLH